MSPEEISEHISEICSHFRLLEPDVRKIMKAADVNKNGKLDYAEFVAAGYDKMKMLSMQNLRRVFDKLDASRTGRI